jgi:two-component system, OmpR family, response regulator BaeR
MNNTLPLSPIAMIIEDDEKLARIFTAAISEAGFTPHTVHRGDVALQELGVFQPRLVILDLNLPGSPGETILKAIREDPRLTKTCVIVTTADAERARVLESEGDLVLVKPVSFSQLRDLSYRLVKTRL